MLGTGLTPGLRSLVFPCLPKLCVASLPSEWSQQKLFSCRAVLGVVVKTFLLVRGLQNSSLAILRYKNSVERDSQCGWKQRIESETAR